MAEPVHAPFGTWTSPITAQDVAVHTWRMGWTDFVGPELWWTRPTPAEGGRVLLYRSAADGSTDSRTDTAAPVLPPSWNVRTSFTEYGGKPFAGYVGEHGPVIVFCEWSDQRLYLAEPDSDHPEPRPLTPAPERPASVRYVDPQILADRGEVWCVRERFHSAEPTDVTREVVAIPLDGSGAARVLLRGQRFLAGLRASPDRRRLAWTGWDHPDMPWDTALLNVAELDDAGMPTAIWRVAGRTGVSIAQAEWLDADTLAYSGDESGWWNLSTVRADGTGRRCVAPAEQEFGGPVWQPGERWFAVLPGGRLAAVHSGGNDIGDGDATTVLSVYPTSGPEPPTHIPLTHSTWIATLTAHENTVACFAGSPSTPYEVVAVDLAAGHEDVVWPGADPFGPTWLPRSAARTFRGRAGQDIHANVHLPRNPGFTGPDDGAKPPFIVFVHGGPTGSSPLVYDLEVAYFTSRGFGVVDVNYGGSAGYGRAYRERLRGNWGVVDVEDCADVVATLAAEGVADPERIAIRGGSAGGWTAACALTSEREAAHFRCGAIRYPVIDPVAWRTGGTHDFESRYLDGLIGAWPEAEARYRERSPIERAARISAPFVLLLGLQDAVCPPDQAHVFLDRARAAKARFAYLGFDGEQHGFRRSPTIVAALEAELSLYGQEMVGSDPPGVPRIELESHENRPASFGSDRNGAAGDE